MGLAVRNALLGLSATLVLTIVARGTSTHPFHETLAQIEHNTSANTLEMAMRIDAIDLDQMVERWLGERIDIEHDSRGERSTELWLRERLAARLPDGSPASMTWIGSEFQGPFAWLYVEFDAPKSAAYLDLADIVLFDWHPMPTNRLVGVGTLKGTAYTTTPDRPVARVRLRPMTLLEMLVDLGRDLWHAMRQSRGI